MVAQVINMNSEVTRLTNLKHDLTSRIKMIRENATSNIRSKQMQKASTSDKNYKRSLQVQINTAKQNLRNELDRLQDQKRYYTEQIKQARRR